MRIDADIVREVLAGKREAFSDLVERHYPKLSLKSVSLHRQIR